MTGFTPVARVDELGEGQQKLVRVGAAAILLCKSDGQVFAIENRCTHDNEQLLNGPMRKCTIVCPMHGARFSLKNGAVLGGPAMEPLTTFPVRIAGEFIEVALGT